MNPRLASLCTFLILAAAPALHSQDVKPAPEFTPLEVSAERKPTFRIHAPNADKVMLASSDLPDIGRGAEMAKNDQGVWELTLGPVPAGAYRYTYDVDGVSTLDPTNPQTSETNMSPTSLLVVPGSDDWDLRKVPHGDLAEVTYFSKSLNRFRRMHVYTPPGYGDGKGTFPVLYLLHGAFDSDDSWSSVGRAGVILDNLIAAGKAKPMIVVMPHGHTGSFRFGPPGDNSFEKQMKEFHGDFTGDIRPHVESRYRVIGDRANRAVAGLSMGGAQTLDIAISNLGDYGYFGVFSSGVFGISEPDSSWVGDHKEALADAAARDGLRLAWFATGKDDFLLNTSRDTVKMLEDQGFKVTYAETEGGHTWLNWRDYLRDFAPLLFREPEAAE